MVYKKIYGLNIFFHHRSRGLSYFNVEKPPILYLAKIQSKFTENV